MTLAPVVPCPAFATRRRRGSVACGAAPLGDPHRVLGVSRDASAAEVKTAFRRLALETHPDVSRDPHSAQRFLEIQAAYDELMHHHHHAATNLEAQHASGVAQRQQDAAPQDKAARLSAQLEGLASRAAAKEARAKAAAYQQSVRLHATRGTVAGACSTDAARERLQGQLGELRRVSRQQAQGEAGRGEAEEHQCSPALLPAPASHTPEQVSRDSLRQLVRLGRLARAWRESSAAAERGHPMAARAGP